jgi:hypothetical protein
MPNKVKLESVVTESFKLHCYETMTGIKFVVLADIFVQQTEAKQFLKQLYEAFADYVLKDPFFVVTRVYLLITILAWTID